MADFALKGEELSLFWKKVIIAAHFLGKLFEQEMIDAVDTEFFEDTIQEAFDLFLDTAGEGTFALTEPVLPE
jgi:hypothetical protein